jgi:hypothetical protein
MIWEGLIGPGRVIGRVGVGSGVKVGGIGVGGTTVGALVWVGGVLILVGVDVGIGAFVGTTSITCCVTVGVTVTCSSNPHPTRPTNVKNIAITRLNHFPNCMPFIIEARTF